MKRIAILGSTGSIGVNTVDVISRMPGEFRVVALSADSNVDLLSAQARRLRPKIVSIGNGLLVPKIKAMVPRGTKVVCSSDGLRELVARRDVDEVVFAISGNACLVPLIYAINHRKAIALANKEALVCAGAIIMGMAKAKGVKIIPVDSEHSAIFQCIDGRREDPARIYLTGSGGPLLDVSAKKFDSLRPRVILKHPKWAMGKKISVDSATMMNKGLEVIEAQALFGLDESRISVLIHPEAIVHSMVEFSDGAVLAQMAVPDMRLPIQYALTYPRRCGAIVRRVDFPKAASLGFRAPDTGKFPCLELARQAARAGGTAPAVLCAADEEVVKCYLEGNLSFSGIPKVIEKVLGRHKNKGGRLSVENILDADAWAREEARALCYH
jgi:1-deoxy-D-xylulose-5-phosphate reductoisomerase